MNWEALALLAISSVIAWVTARYAARYSIVREVERGKYVMYTLLVRYFIAVVSSYENGAIKADELAKESYVETVSAFRVGLASLLSSVYYAKLIEQYSEIPSLMYLADREACDNEIHKELRIYGTLLTRMWELYCKVTPETPLAEKLEYHRSIIEMARQQGLRPDYPSTASRWYRRMCRALHRSLI